MHLDAATLAMIFGVLFGVSEALAAVPQIKANGVFQAINNILKALAGKSDKQS